MEEPLFYPQGPVHLTHHAHFSEWHLQLQYFTEYPQQSEPAAPDEAGSASYLHTRPSLAKLTENNWGLLFPTITLGSSTVQMAGEVGGFPFDWYAGQKSVSVYLMDSHDRPQIYCQHHEAPETLRSPPGGMEYLPTGCESIIPVEWQFFSGLNNGPFRLGISAQGTEVGTSIALWFSRPQSVRVYVLVIALIPLLLGLAFYALIFTRGIQDQRKIGPEAVIAIAASLLAILPIRLVLVPDEISQLTTIDYLLGFEMAILASITCIAVWRTLRPRGNET